MASLTKKTDVLGYSNAYHLLRRTTYHITKAKIQEFALKTPDQALAQLFTFSNPAVPAPLNANKETIIPTAANPTITDTLNTDDFTVFDRTWWLYYALKDVSAQHRIAMFLHLLFVTDDGGRLFNNYDYKELLRFHTNGSLKDLAVRMTLDPRMAVYLSNYLNKKNSPNQNYAREFLELFTILKGPQIATGNYTNYTETDVQQAARVFTGFTINTTVSLNKTARLQSLDPVTNLPKGYINVTNHDTGNKTFSSAFGGQVITGGTTEAAIQAELQAFINMVFNQDETAKAYCRRMYRYFVGRNLTADIESGIITPLASVLKANNYNILPTLQTLLSSKHFYDEEDAVAGDQIIGSLVRSPMELYLQALNLLEMNDPGYIDNPSAIHSFMNNLVFNYSKAAGFPLFQPQTVDGYASYSLSPNYDKNFITTSSLRIRYVNTIDTFISGLTYNTFSFKLNLPLFVKTNTAAFTNPGNADVVVTDFCTLLHIEVPPAARFDYFKSVFLGGLSQTNWLNEWNNFLNTNTATSVKIPLDRLVKALIKSPEFQVL